MFNIVGCSLELFKLLITKWGSSYPSSEQRDEDDDGKCCHGSQQLLWLINNNTLNLFINETIYFIYYAKQKYLGCKKVQGQAEAAL